MKQELRCRVLLALLQHSPPDRAQGGGASTLQSMAQSREPSGCAATGLSPPAQTQIHAATSGEELQLSRRCPYASPPPLFTGRDPGALLSPEMESPTNTEATLYLLSPLLHSFESHKSSQTTEAASKPHIPRPSPKSQPQSLLLTETS